MAEQPRAAIYLAFHRLGAQGLGVQAPQRQLVPRDSAVQGFPPEGQRFPPVEQPRPGGEQASQPLRAQKRREHPRRQAFAGSPPAPTG